MQSTTNQSRDGFVFSVVCLELVVSNMGSAYQKSSKYMHVVGMLLVLVIAEELPDLTSQIHDGQHT